MCEEGEEEGGFELGGAVEGVDEVGDEGEGVGFVSRAELCERGESEEVTIVPASGRGWRGRDGTVQCAEMRQESARVSREDHPVLIQWIICP